ncbi:LPS export ABC transporter permease LptF [Aeromonas simiae]|uniref:LPS export ABC transporter permease LptF n=1 Tax=Aeromonas simiae TaxID=218936 RepID=UPI0005A61EDA|nr:LPS export ABC transporter permease LptF [Aeromonas simiae]MDO2948382.1 LPS export ABC transporter permease LptF [Aeromonas simiae]MDO2951951.1 LPS export ABC transporter permease LptF [Aeromonas simiae]MDO2955765.1 LPS export ABC transporter permease LptF [Aeromonas simiae]
MTVIVFRYLFKETLKTQLAVLFVLLLIFISQQFIKIIAEAAEGDVPTRLVSTLLWLNLPNMALLMLPISLFLAILFAHGRLYAESEMTVMHAVGFSHRFVMNNAMVLALLTASVAVVNTLWIAPAAKEREYQVMDEFKADPGISLLQEGRFMVLDKGRTIAYIQDLDNRGTQLHRVFVVQRAEGKVPPSLVVADEGEVTMDKEGLQWLTLKNGQRFEGHFAGKEFRISEFARYGVVIQQRDLEQSNRKSTAKPTTELLHADIDDELMAELQWRISLPLSILVLTFLVVPLARVNPRQGRYAKLLPAILLYLSYFLLLSAGRSAIASGALPHWPGMFLIPLGYLLFIGLPLNLQGTAWWNQHKAKWLKSKA